MAKQTLVIVDADPAAGWRRETPSLAQLDSALDDLRGQEPDAVVAVVGDPALKWALSQADREDLEERISHGKIVLAPAGSEDGHVGFISKAAARAEEVGLRPVAITDRAVPNCSVARLRRDGTTWVFDLANTTVPTADRAQPVIRRRRKRSTNKP